MGLFTLAVPIPQGKLPAYRRFLSELTGPRRVEFEASRRRDASFGCVTACRARA